MNTVPETNSQVKSKVNERNKAALHRADSGQSLSNYPAIFQGFGKRGIPETEILPRENVFTYAAWKALGRQVRRGEKGIKVVTFVPMKVKDKKDETKTKTVRRPRNTTVFHISQTKAVQNAAI